MKRKRFTEEQFITILKEHAAKPACAGPGAQVQRVRTVHLSLEVQRLKGVSGIGKPLHICLSRT